MLEAVRRYATRILLIHLALLVLVIFVVMGAARQVQVSARAEAQTQSKANVQRLAEQTGNGIESNYRSILSTLDVILRDDSVAATAPAAPPAATVPATRPGAGRSQAGAVADSGRRGGGGQRGGGRGGRGFFRPNLLGTVNVNENTLSLLWKQLKGPVSQIFLVDATNGLVVERSAAPGGVGAIGGGGAAVAGEFSKFVYPQESYDAAAKIVKENLEWIRGIKDVQMSSFHAGDAALPGAANGYHLIALPALEVNVFGGGGGGPGGALNGGRGGGGNRGGPEAGGGQGGFGRGDFGRGGRGGPRGGGGGPFGGPGGPGGPGGQGGPGDQGPQGGLDRLGEAGGPGFGPGTGGPGEPPGPGREAPKFAMVVVVPVDVAADEFLATLNGSAGSAPGTGAAVNAILVNESGQVLVSNTLLAAGVNLLEEIPEAAVRSQIQSLIAPRSSESGGAAEAVESVVFADAFHIGTKLVEPQILGSSQFVVPSGRHWTVLLSSPLSETDQVVNRLFRSALTGSIVLSLAIAGILASTSFFLINSRVRLERTRHEVLTRELEQARHIQLAWLPDLKSVPAGLDISAANLPASHISGDFYNWFLLPGNANDPGAGEGENSKVAIVIGDVTGHGMAAAFLMATAQLLVKVTLTRWHDPAKCLREVNRQLCTQGFQGQFVTMLVLVFDPVSNTIEVATAGHPTPLVEREGKFEGLALEPQLVLGVDPTENYRSQSFILEPGASLLLYTDGVVEAETESGDQYGVENLMKALQVQEKQAAGGGMEGADPAARIRAVLEDVKRFTGGRELLDDVTLVAVRTSAVAAAV